jgi:hypothetical protein
MYMRMNFKFNKLPYLLVLIYVNSITIFASYIERDKLFLNALEKPAIIEKLKARLKTGYNAKEPSDKTKQIMQEAIKACQLSYPIIILEAEKVKNTVQVSLECESNYFVYCILCRSNLYDPYLIHAIYHEIGHIVNKDIHPSTFIKRKLAVGGVIISGGMAIGYASNLLLRKISGYDQSQYFGLACAVLGSYMLLQCYNKFFKSTYSKKQELHADTFTAKKLIALKKYQELLFMMIYYYVKNGNGGLTHPSDKQRADLILKELKKEKLNVSELLEKLNDWCSLKKLFPYVTAERWKQVQLDLMIENILLTI